MKRRILIVSDRALNAATPAALTERGFELTTAENADETRERLTTGHFDLLVIDLNDPIESARIVKWIRAHGTIRRVPILAIAEWGSGAATMALAQGADAFEAAPIDSQRFMAAVERLLPKAVLMAKAGGPNGNAQGLNRTGRNKTSH